MQYGRWINDADNLQERKVCVLGKRAYTNLFPEGGDPVGKRISIDGTYYMVIGVNGRSTSGISINGSAVDAVTIPINLARKVYNQGNVVHLLCITAKEGVTMSDIMPRIREVISRAHYIDPTDEQAMRTAVLRPIIFRYSRMVTAFTFSKSMSYCWPSHTCAAVVENRSSASLRTFSGACAIRL